VIAVLMPLITSAALLSGVLTSVLVGTVLRDFSAEVLGLRIGRIDTIFSVAGLLVLVAAVYARRAVRLPSAPAPAAPPATPAATTTAEAGRDSGAT
jgi:hypothetical protein